jgi:hypothetical protein
MTTCLVTHVSLHYGSVPTGGSQEFAMPQYSRRAVSWTPVSYPPGGVALTADADFGDLQRGAAAIGAWSAAEAGEFLGWWTWPRIRGLRKIVPAGLLLRDQDGAVHGWHEIVNGRYPFTTVVRPFSG